MGNEQWYTMTHVQNGLDRDRGPRLNSLTFSIFPAISAGERIKRSLDYSTDSSAVVPTDFLDPSLSRSGQEVMLKSLLFIDQN